MILTTFLAPKANAHAERWVHSARWECLDWMLIVSQRHLEKVLAEDVRHYNRERPHRSRDVRAPAGALQPGRNGAARSRSRLGGLTHEYYRQLDAA